MLSRPLTDVAALPSTWCQSRHRCSVSGERWQIKPFCHSWDGRSGLKRGQRSKRPCKMVWHAHAGRAKTVGRQIQKDQ